MSEIQKQLPAESTAPLTGPERAALVLRELGEDAAAAVLREMDESTVNRISTAMTSLKKVSSSVREDVMISFANDLGFTGVVGDSMKFLGRVLVSALGEAQAKEILDRLSQTGKRSGFNLPANTDARTLAVQMASERPQTIALLLAHIPRELAANVLTFLPETLAVEALYRFSTLDVVSPNVMTELGEMLKDLTNTTVVAGRRLTNLGGAKQAADILNHFQAGMADTVLGAIDRRDAKIAEKIRENLFTFNDLIKLADRALQILLREVSSERIAPALRLADEALRNRLFQNLSARQVEIIKEELRSGPPLRRAEVLTAQNEIVDVALKLAAEGRITINATEEMV